ncbi:25779_t:CDS:2 [Racocetra persica]|uniref:25779_t:CDS:1 n=1 Tax=Racocetra persica TaxID=160502 RepID=A0ACA9QQ79_9GLOM|nr:25779_t:CDS:2 [Racocetra persica]
MVVVVVKDRGCGHRPIANQDENEIANHIEYLPLASTENLIQRVCAAIYLSLDKL